MGGDYVLCNTGFVKSIITFELKVKNYLVILEIIIICIEKL